MATKKVTKNERYEQLLAIPAVAENKELVEFIQHEQELLVRKNTNKDGEKKLTAQQEQNALLKEQLYDALVVNGKQTISQLAPQLTSETEITHGRIVSMLTQLRNENRIVREKKGKETFYSVAEV